MIMSSIGFLYFFLPLFIGVYALTPAKHRAKTLLLGELVFVGWGSVYALIPLLVSMLGAYLLGMLIDNRRNNKPAARGVLTVAVTIELSMIVLAVLSSLGIINEKSVISRAFPPVGVFVYTLGAMSYCLDIYKGKNRCDHRFTLVAAYVGFFPCITAGPLLRYSDISNELSEPRLSADKLSRGISLYLKGLAERCVLSFGAHNMWQQLIRLDIRDISAVTAWLGLIMSGMYVYFEFASITHMARGVSLMIGIDTPVNFDHPFRARSMLELVKKFNATVTSYFTDYIYSPLRGENGSKGRTAIAALLTAVTMSLWYGASVPKLIFGAYIGLLCLTELAFGGKVIKKLPYPVGMIITMTLAHIGFIFFICKDIRYAVSLILAVFGKNGMLMDNLTLYFAQNFAVFIAIGVFISTGLAELLYQRIEHSKHNFLPFIRPLTQLVLLVVSTAFLSGMEQEYLGLIQ